MSNSSFDNSVHSTSQQSTQLLDYLIRKLEARGKTISKYVLTLLNNKQFVLPIKNDIISLLNDLEIDLKQAASAIKALLSENKILAIKRTTAEINRNTERIIEKLNKENSRLHAENESLLMQVQHHNTQQWPIMKEDDDVGNDNDNTVNILHKQLTDISEKNERINMEVASNKMDMQFSKGRNKNASYSNLNKIIENLKQNKCKLKQVIKQHFESNNNKNNNNNVSQNKSLQHNDYLNCQKKQESSISLSNEVIMRIMNTPNAYVVLNKQLGCDVIKELANEKCSSEFVTNVVNILDELDNNNNANNYETQFKQQMKMQSKKQRDPISLNRNTYGRKNFPSSPTQHNKILSYHDDGSFERELKAHLENKPVKNNTTTTNNNNENTHRIYPSYTDSYPNDFYSQ